MLHSTLNELIKTAQAVDLDNISQISLLSVNEKNSVELLGLIKNLSTEITQSLSEKSDEIQKIFLDRVEMDADSMRIILKGLKDNLIERCLLVKATEIIRLQTKRDEAFMLMMDNLIVAVTFHTDMMLNFHANMDDCMALYVNFLVYYKHFGLHLGNYKSALLKRLQESIRDNNHVVILAVTISLYNLTKALSQFVNLNAMLNKPDLAKMILKHLHDINTHVRAQLDNFEGFSDELEQISELVLSTDIHLQALSDDVNSQDAPSWRTLSGLILNLFKNVKSKGIRLSSKALHANDTYDIFLAYKKRLEAEQPIAIRELEMLGEKMMQRLLDDNQHLIPKIVMQCMTAYAIKLEEVARSRSDFSAWFAYTGLLGICKMLSDPGPNPDVERVQESKIYALLKQYRDLEQSKKNQNQQDIKKIQEGYTQSINEERKKHLKNMSDLKKEHDSRLKFIKNAYDVQRQQQNMEYEQELRNLNEKNENALNAFDQAQLGAIKSLEVLSAERVIDARHAHEQAMQAKAVQYQQQIAVIDQREKEAMARIVGLPEPVAQIKIAATTQTILNILEDAKIEYFILGGFLRNQLFNSLMHQSQANKHSDIDVIVNLNAELLPNAILKSAHRDTNLPKLLRIGPIDFWCQPWNSIEEVLKTKDFAMNTLVAKADGQVYDFLRVGLATLTSPELQVLGDVLRYSADPTLVFRGVRFCIHLGKMFSNRDWAYIAHNPDLMKKVEMSVYLRNLERIFIDQDIVKHFWYAMNMDFLPILFPFKPHTKVSVALTADQCLSVYLTLKLNQLAQSPSHYRIQAFLALILLVIHFVENQNDYLVLNKACITRFFNWLGKDVQEKEYSELVLVLEGMLYGSTSYMGLFKEYCAYAEQNRAYYEAPQPMITPAYEQYTITQQAPPPPQSQSHKPDSRHSIAQPYK